MEEERANRFVSSLVKSIQALCNGCIEFSSSIEVVGHIHLSIDRSVKVDYVLAEEVSRSSSSGEDTTLFASHSYHSKPPSNCTSSSKNNADLLSDQCQRNNQTEIEESECMDFPSDGPVIASVEPDTFCAPFNYKSVRPTINIKRKRDQAVKRHAQNSLDMRDNKTASSDSEVLTAKRRRNNCNLKTESSSLPEVIEIKEEIEEDELSDSYGFISSDTLAEQGAQSSDLSNSLIESLGHIGHLENSQQGSSEGGAQAQHAPYPVVLHSHVDVPGSSVDVSSLPSRSGGYGCYKKYSKSDLSRALDMVHNGASLFEVSLKTGVPESTIRRYMKKCPSHQGACRGVMLRKGVDPILTKPTSTGQEKSVSKEVEDM